MPLLSTKGRSCSWVFSQTLGSENVQEVLSSSILLHQTHDPEVWGRLEIKIYHLDCNFQREFYSCGCVNPKIKTLSYWNEELLLLALNTEWPRRSFSEVTNSFLPCLQSGCFQRIHRCVGGRRGGEAIFPRVKAGKRRNASVQSSNGLGVDTFCTCWLSCF